jgi:purine-nucleoside phosphorylase
MAAKKQASEPAPEFRQAEAAAKFIQRKTKLRPQIALVLGSGLGAFADEFANATRIPYPKIPRFPRSTAIGHAGQLVLGTVGGVPVAAMQGRVHLYEGYTAKQVAFPMRVFARMGVKAVILTNAAGGINLSYSEGALAALRDHINLQGANPLTGPNDDRFGPRFPDMTRAYDPDFTKGYIWRSPVPTMKRLRRFTRSARSAQISSACPPYPKCSPPATPAFVSSASPA